MSEEKRHIDKIIIHCSDSSFGDASIVKKWHTLPKMPAEVAAKIRTGTLPKSEAAKYGNGWSDTGYHFIVLNGYRKGRVYRPEDDGLLEKGRPWYIPGAHCRGENETSIGICLIGKRTFTAKQLYLALPEIIKMVGSFNTIEVYGHYEFDSHKSCPNIDMDLLRKVLKKGGV